MKKILSVLCAAAIMFTTVAIGVSANEVVTPENQDPAIATTIVCSSKPTTVMNYATNAQRRSIASVSKITDNESMRALGFKTYNGFDTTLNSTHHVAAFDFPSGAVTDVNGGYIFYLDLPVFNSYEDVNVPIPHDIAIQRHSAAGTVLAHTQKLDGKNDTIPWYVLPEGESEWQTCNEWVTKGGSPYALRISDGTKPFRGYVYIPTKLLQKNGYVDTSGKEIGSISFTVDVDRKTYGGSGDGRGSERGVAPIDVSAITLVSSFNKNSTLIYNDYGQLVDLASEEPVEDINTASMTSFADEFGNLINLFHTSESIPSSVTGSKNVGLVKNTTGLPFTTLMDFTVGSNDHTNLHWDAQVGGKGAMFYLEMPESENGGDVRFSTQFYVTDGQSGEKNDVRQQYGYQNWYFLAEGDTAWTAKTISYYGIPLPSGFKGYVYIPFKTVTSGASDIPDTPEDENYPQERDNEGNLVYKDNITGSKTTNATDENGAPNTPIHTYQPSNTNPYYKNAGIDDEDTLTGIMIQTGGNYMVKNGNMKETDKIVVSAPVIVKGEGDDYTLPDTRKLTINEKVEYLFESYTPYEGSAAHTTLRTPTGTPRDETFEKYTITKIPNICPLVNGAYEIGNLTSGANRSFQSNNSMDTELSSGVVFYVETNVVNPEFNINVYVNVNGTWTYPATSYDSGDMYYLREGDAKWLGTGSMSSSGASATYRRKITSDTGFKGYIYQPYGGSAATVNAAGTTGYYGYAGISVFSGEGDWLDKNGETAYLKVSRPMVVSSLETTTNLVTLDGGALVDPITNKAQTYFNEATKFVGDKSLIDLVGDVMSVAPLTNSSRDAKKVFSSAGTFVPVNGYTGAFAENTTVFGDTLARIQSTASASQTGADLVEMYFNSMTAADHSGYMLYMQNDSQDTLYFAFQPYGRKAEGGTDYTQLDSASLSFLKKEDGAWKWISKARVTSYTYALEPGESGFIYLSVKDLYSRASYDYLKIRTSQSGSYPTVNANFLISAPIAVKNFTTNAAGMAFVNGAEAPQDLYSGDFTVPNDYDGNLKVNLLDLARGKAKGLNVKNLKDAYFSDYYKEIEIPEQPEEEEEQTVFNPISLDKSLTPLTASDYKLLSDNPDRGYRTEMVIGLQEKYDEGETRDARNLYTSGTEAEIRETMNQIFEIYFPTNAEHHSKLVLAFIGFRDWNKSEYLPQEVLDVLDIYFEYCRKYEIRVLVRFAYGVPTNLYIANAADREKLEKVCADEATMIRHIKQLAPFVAKHRDVIHKISSGWIGNGEMVASFQWPAVNFDNVIRAVVEEMCVPNDLYFTVRLPRYKVDMLNNYKAATGTDYPYADIIGYNNDGIYGEQNKTDHHSGCYQYDHINCGKGCFLNQSNYFDEWEYVIKNAAYTPQSGEMFTNAGLNERNVVPTGIEVMLEMAHHRYNTFSQWHGYQETSVNRIFEKWMSEENYSVADMESFGIIYDPNSFVDSEGNAVTQNPYEYMRDHLGYKLVAETTSFNWSGKAEDFATVSLSFKNYGFAAPFTLESGFAILDENYNVVKKIEAGDPDTWYSLHPDYYTDDYEKSGSIQDDILSYNLETQIKVPNKAGKYYVAFYLQNDLGEGARLSNDLDFEKEFNILHEITVK